FVIAGLKRFRVPTRSRLYLLRGLRLMPDTAARTIFQHRERLFRMGRMEPVSPAAHIGKHTVIPAEITVKAHQTALLRLGVVIGLTTMGIEARAADIFLNRHTIKRHQKTGDIG